MGMPSFNVSMFLLILSLLSFLSLNSEAAPEYRYHFCSNETTFTPNSTYHSNFNRLLSSLTSNSTRESGFYNTTVGQTPETTVYGLFFCRGDLTPDDCRVCVSTATKEIVEQYCPIQKVAVIWYSECVLRYSNKSFFSTMDEVPSVSLYNIQNTTEQDRFFLLLGASMNEIGVKASTAPPGAKKFATKEANFSEFQTTYSLVQCDPLLSSSDCSRCFVNLISYLLSCCAGKQGVRSYELFGFSHRFFGCGFQRKDQWVLDSDQACKFFKWLDKNTCPRGRATALVVHERFTRYKAEAAAVRNERDEAHAMEVEAREQLRIVKRKAQKTKLTLRIAEDKVYKYRLALLLSWTVVRVYFVFSTVFGGHGHTQLHLP
ncbi:cysteine-rich receptor-like protein kinase 25 [Quercus suber]|uniref:Cysteine-rich receptor-like protein kinase 25 n=1 Tax=Quercus suber TaxID=58331 RepID=A0AAW0KI14_QUESU